MRRISLRPRAGRDIESIVVHLSFVLGSPNAVQEWYGKLRETLSLLCEQPSIGRVFQDERLHARRYRTFLVKSYRAFYTFDAAELVVWRVLHTSQDIDDYALVDF